MDTIGDRLARLRVMRGLRLKEIAAKTGVSLKQFNDYERGANAVKYEFLVKAKEALNVPWPILTDLSLDLDAIINEVFAKYEK